jgi:hypothetical protein
MNQKLKEEIKDTIRLLLGLRPASHVDEALIKLYRLQFLVQFPAKPELADVGAFIIAAKQLRSLEFASARQQGLRAGSSIALKAVLQTNRYAQLYDMAINGWYDTGRGIGVSELGNLVGVRWADNATVAELIDFRFRYLQHEQRDPRYRI